MTAGLPDVDDDPDCINFPAAAQRAFTCIEASSINDKYMSYM